MKYFKHLVTPFLLAVCAGCAENPASVSDSEHPTFSKQFEFGVGPAELGGNPYTTVPTAVIYNKETGFGFEPDATVQVMPAGGSDAIHAGLATSGNIFRFSVAVPEGNYKVTVTFGDANAESTTTVKAEARRLMLERIHTAPGQFATRSFLVSVRNPQLPDGRMIKLDVQEVNLPNGQHLTPTWDDKLTLQFSGDHPCVDAIAIESVAHPITVFLMSDSTVTDQQGEPYGTWGQMLPRWFKPPVVIANYAESGETLKAFRAELRWDKILSQIKPGDYVFMQFGTNDLNTGVGRNVHNAIWPADDHAGDWANTYVEGEDYKNLLKQYAAEAKAHGAIPVIISPMTKIDSATGAVLFDGLRKYPKDAIDAAREAGVAYIDLNAMSVEVDQALNLGPAMAQRVYMTEGLHQRTYGGYLFSRCIVEGIKQDNLGLAKYLVDDAGSFDPKHPQPLPDDFKIPLEPRGGRAGAPRGPATPAPANPPARARGSPPPSI